MAGKLESTLNRIIDEVNRRLAEAKIESVYKLDIREREAMTIVEDMNSTAKTPKRKRVYYGTLVILNKSDNGTYAVWRQEYQFHNLTDKQSDLLWRERLCEAIMYEGIGTFIAFAYNQLLKDKEGKSPKYGIYDVEQDRYLNIEIDEDTTTKEEIAETTEPAKVS